MAEVAAQPGPPLAPTPAPPSPPPAGDPLAAGDERSADGVVGAAGARVSASDIQTVQNLIERCLQLYMSQREVVFTLQAQAKARVEPSFTALVWQKLEEQNADFFRAYYTRLKLKDQVVLFNHLLEQQVQVLGRLRAGGGGGGRGGAAGVGGVGAWAGLGLAPPPPRAALFGGGAGDGSLGPLPAAELPLGGGDGPGLTPAPDLVAPGLPRTASEQSLGSLVHGGDGGPAPPGSRTADAGLVGLPRNFSLSDLAFDNTGG